MKARSLWLLLFTFCGTGALADDCAHVITADVMIIVSTGPNQRATALAGGYVKDHDGTVCFETEIFGTITITEDNSLEYETSVQGTGDLIKTFEAPAQVESCYVAEFAVRALLDDSFPREWGSAEDQDGPECWYGPPPPEDPDEGNGCPGAPGCNSPIILDLDHDGYVLTSASQGVNFDIRNEGRTRRVAWTRPSVENAFLALDRNGNGRIDNGAELFGNFTPLRSGELAPHGFAALAELDSNGDGLIDSRDQVWPALILWTDRNHDGVSTSSELRPVAKSNVRSLETRYHLARKRDRWGNLFYYASHFGLLDRGREKRVRSYDVFVVSE